MTNPRFEVRSRADGSMSVYDRDREEWVCFASSSEADYRQYCNALNILEDQRRYYEIESRVDYSRWINEMNEREKLFNFAKAMYHAGHAANLPQDLYEPFSAFYERYLKQQ